MNPQRIFTHLKRRTCSVAVLITTLVLCAVGIVSGMAQSTQDDTASPTGAERQFEDITAGHVPIKVKLKGEMTFKNMKNKNWARELELEVKNTGNKPIYFMFMNIVMRDVLISGDPYAFQISYGRKDLVRLTTELQPEDMPIRPGETITLKIPESQVKAYEGYRDKDEKIETKRVELNLQFINFGDGTGLRSHKGRPAPNPARKQTSSAPPLTGEPSTCTPLPRPRSRDSSTQFI